MQVHVSPARSGRMQVGPGADPRHRNLRPLHSSPRPPRRLVSIGTHGRSQIESRNRDRRQASPPAALHRRTEPGVRLAQTAVSPTAVPAPCSSMAAGYVLPRRLRSSPLDDFLRQTSVAAGPGTRTLRRYRHDLGLEVRNDRYSVLRSRGGVRGEGADAQLRRRRSSLSPPRSQGAPQSGGRRLGRCLTPN